MRRRTFLIGLGALATTSLAACGGGGASTPTASAFRPSASGLPAAGTPPAVLIPLKIGDTASLKGYSITLHAVKDPAGGAAPVPGQRLVAYDVTLSATGGQLIYSALDSRLKLVDNTEMPSITGGQEPALAEGTLAKGSRARGWLSFAIPSGGKPAFLTYEISAPGRGGMAIFKVG